MNLIIDKYINIILCINQLFSKENIKMGNDIPALQLYRKRINVVVAWVKYFLGGVPGEIIHQLVVY